LNAFKRGNRVSVSTSGRRLAVTLGAAVVVLTSVGLPTAAAQGGVPAVTDPRAVPSPGSISTGLFTDACDDISAPGWIGTDAPTLSVTASSPGARFKVWDELGAKVFDESAQTDEEGAALVQPTGLANGRTYSWQAWPDYFPGGGTPTAVCHFRVDTAVPLLAVDSSDFPASGTGATAQKYAGQAGVFTLTGTDEGSGVACYRYVLNGTLGVGGEPCQGSGTVAADADGRAALQLTPAQWGTNILTVQAVDNAGNVSQPVTYTFYAPSNPKPATAPGDVNGDGVPDILLPDAAGNLQIISADATGTTPTSTVPAAQAPNGASWQAYQLAHRGWGSFSPPVDDLFAHLPGGRSLHVYDNFHLGAYNLGTKTTIERPELCGASACPPGYQADWSKTEQLFSLGSLKPGYLPSLLTVEDGDLWLFGDARFGYRFRTVTRLSTGGAWAGYDIIAPGRAADGSLALWSRERATGTLRVHPIAAGADGTFDSATLADPAAGTVVGSAPVADYPILASSGDGNADGAPDLYAVTSDRHLVTFNGVTDPKDLGALN